MNSYIGAVLTQAQNLQDSIIADRRHLHQNPELSFMEYDTSAYIQGRLQSMNIPFTVMAETGVVALIGKGMPCIALRADIDALPISEETGLEFRSQKQGIMHACGHDAHTAMLLGAAQILKKNEDKLKGTVKLIFQPGEEKVPGGASLMVAAGVLENPRPSVIFGQHVYPDAPTGTILLSEGPMMASADELYWTIHGKGAHAAQPHQGIDPILMASELILHLQSLITKFRNPLLPGVLGITSIHGGSATNIIPEKVEMKGTLRSFDAAWREEAIHRIEKHSKELCALYGGSCDIQILRGYPAVYNNPTAAGFARQIALELAGQAHTADFEPKMWGEDFAYYGQHIPAAFWMLGVRPEGSTSMPGLHNARFTPDEKAFATGTAMMAAIAMEWLEKKSD
jgi:amidohydrolase